MGYENIIVERREAIGVITLNRPKSLNALSAELTHELQTALTDLDSDETIGCMVITGSEKAFAAGADIKEMQSKTFMEAYLEDFITCFFYFVYSYFRLLLFLLCQFIFYSEDSVSFFVLLTFVGSLAYVFLYSFVT